MLIHSDIIVYIMKKILAIISALITGVLAIAISITPQAAEAGRELN